MPVRRQEALIVPPRGVQVGPGAVGGVITPRSLVQHGDEEEEEEEEETHVGEKWAKQKENEEDSTVEGREEGSVSGKVWKNLPETEEQGEDEEGWTG